jgi:hypothetical protein
MPASMAEIREDGSQADGAVCSATAPVMRGGLGEVLGDYRRRATGPSLSGPEEGRPNPGATV